MKTTVIIPARMASSRFPGKPLVEIRGLPMIEHVRRRAMLAEGIDRVIVATCDQKIFDVVEQAGGKAIMTADTHERCTTRVDEACRSSDSDIVVVIAGDEPLTLPETIEQVVKPVQENDEIDCTNILSEIRNNNDFTDMNIVKTATDQKGFILYYSRSPIPYYRLQGECPIYRQTGLMAFRTPFLHRYTALSETPFEKVESVDMLRLLEHGYRILGVPTSEETYGVDHPGDIDKVLSVLKTDVRQQKLYKRSLEVSS
ncbi:MAG: 3-deoxy-manno-octulosonate cytidylyltransferase [Desulfobacterales bacterium]|jgi:3-deoxy-manno-octulosonate cytidylyltransferase (CMP-KDO synthetase)|nr:3-deoxy-manno-octulosonate cytidylyltransferase [Desulfobacterales bacterium]MDP6808196.1 3-deoxy-manno-octulosonate cytidylyltransferase [Desulfobacterales bacterium]|tara:strand:+ start:31031 stop:31801 length:771 start_codon:yes stop_codon:yes gene_type:complete